MSETISSPFLVAVAQTAPVFLDKQATVEKACAWIAEAGARGARLVLFPETFIPAYPDWVWLIPPGKKALTNQVYEKLSEQAISVPDSSTEKIGAAAKKAGIHVAIGINERNSEASNASLYNTLLYFDAAGQLMGRHRKLVPTGAERLMWAPGDASTLEVFSTPMGKLGGLICWENYMPLARYYLYSQGIQIYLAPTWDHGEVWISSLRHIAKEGACFVLSACMPLRAEDIPDSLDFKRLYAGKEWINPGGSCIIAPNGNLLAGPVLHKEELILATLDPSLIPAGKWMLDTAGHYARPDVFRMSVNREPNPMISEFRI